MKDRKIRISSLKSLPYLLFNIPYILFSRDHNENKAFKALFCVIPAITSQLVFNFLTDLFLLDIVIICSTDSAIFYLWRNIPTYLPTYVRPYKFPYLHHCKIDNKKIKNKTTQDFS